jgi:hypothetical protein
MVFISETKGFIFLVAQEVSYFYLKNWTPLMKIRLISVQLYIRVDQIQDIVIFRFKLFDSLLNYLVLMVLEVYSKFLNKLNSIRKNRAFFLVQSNLCTTTTLGIWKKWSLFKSGRYSEGQTVKNFFFN